MAETALTTFIAALFSMMNPVGNVGIFVGMTADRDGAESKKIAEVRCRLCHHAPGRYMDRRRAAQVFRHQHRSAQGCGRHHRYAHWPAHAF